MEKAKAEVEKKVSKALKFIQTKNKIPKEAKKELLGLITDLHEQCQSLYSIFDDLQEGYSGNRGKIHTAASSSSSDWEYYSSEETESNLPGNVNEAVAGNLSSKEKTESAESKLRFEALNSEHAAVVRKLKEAELTYENLRRKTGEREQELTERVKELERQLGDADSELRAQKDRNRELEEQIVMRAGEAKHLGEKNKGLQGRILGLELVLKEKGHEISNLVNKFGISEVRLTSRIEDLKSQVSNLQQETDFLRTQNVELAGDVEDKKNKEIKHCKDLMDHVNISQHELESLRNQRKELESELVKRTEEVARTQMRLKHLEEAAEERVKADLKILEEKKILLTKVEKLELETNSLQKEKYEFSDQMKSKITELDRLREENQKLHTKMAELDSSQMEKQKKNIEEIEVQSMKLDKKLSDPQKPVKEQDDIIRRLSAKIKDQQKLLKEQKDTIDKLSEQDQKLVKRGSFGSIRDPKLNPIVLERKMEELADDFRMKMEDHIRILYRRIHVAEQIHLESKHEFIKTRENMGNGESKGNLAFCETQFKKIKEMFEHGLTRSDVAIKKVEEAGEYTARVTRIAKEMDAARTWVREKNSETEQMKHEVETLAAKLECREAQESLLKEKLSKLETKLAEEGTEKLGLAKVLSKFDTRIKELEIEVKRKEVELVSLGEEKRDAIRQLCVLVDYQRCRYDDLKRSILKFALKP
ncbi:PREDICTED: myosin heavy chain, non-muscle isoform X1 [Tarenaya hassleriana]|uniref:myosin heavy chain, non-muscle isoform X1 n=1 Tax=Tarenaya hassleriana TaxID=28532 RepID=UPI00053C19BC|nr:PREDICTED: myosin heavy chain, non-muscle isoform X1 [Tarenaya hassleriana]XP_010533601.1 PREDICTED: myosin heavy chain, non-muscle isoform X2 [Tarenaya hassleriana]XP_010533602.1 PREDICTED: myosin heavy chain, non-muscle isoform X3 [Tarenaya hassleriana]XP_010533603.1 PREDICTED: myosin heavy chain, non-muscle isoform X1 [Tarenaya hassleriana]XP_010533604.1 PREDICTED: myosin heavy chain, non-muscle isoform X1 [Tarenaya hassleriana]XP_010533605.1 PREDICTED: myosin heavy chain, non-muscle iso